MENVNNMSEEIHNKEIKPKYSFVKEEGDESVNPYKRKIAKTMEVTEMFNLYDALEYVAKMKKAKESKLAEVEGLDKMIDAYEKEIASIEESLGLKELEASFLSSTAEVASKVSENAEEKENA